MQTDPAVVLLARHLSVVSGDQPEATTLQTRCMHQIRELERTPALSTLAYRGVSYDAPAKARFHAEGTKAMRRLASALGLEPRSYQIRLNKGGIAVSGEIILHAERFYIQLNLGLCGMDREVLFRRCRGRDDYCGERNHFAGVGELLDPARFSARIRRELELDLVLPAPPTPLAA